MMGLIIAVHVIACVLLIIIILIQAGRGGGLVEGFSNVESMFGPKTNTFLTRTTTIFSIVFFVTCLSLALLSSRQNRSLMKNVQVEEPKSSASTPVTPTAAPAKEVNQTAAPVATPAANVAETTKQPEKLVK